MITVYTFDPQNIFIAAMQVDPMDKLPSPCTLTEPPVLSGTEVAQWTGTDWLVLAEHPPLPEPSAEVIQSEIVTATQQRLDDFAKTRNYFGILSACTYATSTNATFAAEAQYCVEKRDQTWSTIYQIEADVKAGTRPMPTGYAEIEPELPSLVWPI